MEGKITPSRHCAHPSTILPVHLLSTGPAGAQGLLHPPDRVVAYVRYVPDPRGSRVGPDGTRYAKVYSLLRREEVIRSRFPEYMYFDKFFNRWLQAVPLSRIRRVYSPTSRLREIVERGARDGLEELARGLAERLSSSGVELESMGVSGSLLVGLHTEGSDIDLVVYGEREGRLLYSYLKDVLTDQGELRAYREEELLKLYENSLAEIKEGEIVKGRVLKVDRDDVIVDVGFKSEGIIPLSEFGNHPEVKVGDEIEVFLESIEDQDGQVVLSKSRADFLLVWDRIRKAYETGEPIEGKVRKRVKYFNLYFR